ncbi:unnamed protein product [Lactuca virosa]|uniref:Uncharacterized protein n=1 Tax=Lactuca virosa TaxID=75947 RepID=A0AAU9NFW3_9ASTR|nr:unnamed protein product [Lactuca virosa]
MAFRAPRRRCRTIPFGFRSSSWLMAKLGGMKHRMKKKRQRPSASGSQNPNPSLGQIDDHSRVLNGVEEGTSSVSIQEHAAAAEIIETPSSSIIVHRHRDDDSAESFRNLTETEADLTFSEEDEGSGMIIDLRGHSVEIALLLLKIQLSLCSLIGYVGKVTVIIT